MTKEEALEATREFVTIMKHMELAQVWTAMTFCLQAAMKMTPEEHLSEVMQHLFVMLDDGEERGTLH